MAARDLRYAWFEEIRLSEGLDYVATAHHLNDQVETFFINLIRGTGIAGLHGIPKNSNRIIRPLLHITRSEIEHYLEERNVPFVEDSSNSETKYLRNKLRHEILPKFNSMNPRFLFNLAGTIAQVNQYEQIAKDAIASKLEKMLEIKGEKIFLKLDDIVNIPGYQAYLFEFLSPYGFNKSTLDDLNASLKEDNSGLRFFSETHRLIKDRNHLILSPLLDGREVDSNEFFLIKSDLSSDAPFIDAIQEINKPLYINTDEKVALLDFQLLQLPLHIRHWRKGDYFYPLGLGGKKMLSDFFVDQKFSLIDKEETWLLCSGSDIVWVMGYRIDDRYKVSDSTQNVLKIKLK